jgi:NAD(P)-dependent dehydrogenase (short-subunit alcohol dehydrogenase family)
MLENKVIVVTGAAGLLGNTFSKAILKNGGKCIMVDVSEKAINTLRSEISSIEAEENYLTLVADTTNPQNISGIIETAKSTFGRIDALVNNAYPRNKTYGHKLENVSMDSFNENISLQLGGYFECMKQFSVFFKNQGHGNIVSMSSIYGIMAPRFEIYDGTEMTMPVEYAAIKAALINLTKYFAKYYKGSNIRFNCLCPGGNRRDDHKTEFVSKYNQYGMSKGLLDKDDLTGTLLFLLSENSKMINGQNIVVDDGWSL